MKPTKNRIYCQGCKRLKMVFETERKAENFMKFNNAAILEESGYAPQRSYYCEFCCGWHVTKIKEDISEQMAQKYATMFNTSSKESIFEATYNEIMREIESEIKYFDVPQKKHYFNVSINNIENKILEMKSQGASAEDLKEWRQKRQIFHIAKKQNGFTLTKRTKYESPYMKEWNIWAKKNGYPTD